MASGKSKGAFGFDPVGLERAAAAAKDLDKSPNAQKAFDLLVKQEDVKSQEVQASIK
jgi:ATPase family AAA domain-containing protein 3A/B